MIRCINCGKFVSKNDIHVKLSEKGHYHFPNCFMYQIVSNKSFEGKILRTIIQNANLTITHEFSISPKTLMRNVKNAIKMIHESK